MKKLFFALFAVLVVLSYGCKDDNENKNNTTENDTINFPGYEEFTINNNEIGNDNDVNNDNENTNVQPDTNTTIITNDNVMVEDNQGNPVPATNQDLNNANKNFYIIVGSYKKLDNANKRMKYFKDMGYTAEVLPLFGSYYRVSIASFNNETSSRNELKNLRTKFKDPSFWLLYR